MTVQQSKEMDEQMKKLREEIDIETKAKEALEWSNKELEKSVRIMEENVRNLEKEGITNITSMKSGEVGNTSSDAMFEGPNAGIEAKNRYDSQRMMNLQLEEQKKWLEHEIAQIRAKIQSDKQHPLPNPFSLDWNELSASELKRLTGELVKTRNNLRSRLNEMQFKLDKEGKEYTHYDHFFVMYEAELKLLDRTLESLSKTTVIPHGFDVAGLPATTSIVGTSHDSGQNSSTQLSRSQSPPLKGGGSWKINNSKRVTTSVSPPTLRRKNKIGNRNESPTRVTKVEIGRREQSVPPQLRRETNCRKNESRKEVKTTKTKFK